MAEEYRLFLRTAIYVAIAGGVYWLLSYEAAGTVLLVGLLLALLAFVALALAFAGRGASMPLSGGVLGWLNGVIGFGERVDGRPPLEGGLDLIPLTSAWPIVTAAAVVVIGLGLIFGPWLTVPGVILLLIGGLGWLVQLDDAYRAG